MEFEEFLKPKLVGGRFEVHAIPLDFLRDLAALNDIIMECARSAYLKANPGRSRLPKGFADEFALCLSGVEPGSALPAITLFFGLLGVTPEPVVDYLRTARDNLVRGVRAAAEDRQPTEYLPPEQRFKRFKNFGERLRETARPSNSTTMAHRYASPRKCVVSFCCRPRALRRFRKRSIFAGLWRSRIRRKGSSA